MLIGISTIFFFACKGRETQLLEKAELIALDNPDSATILLEQVDTARLNENDRALYALTQALILEEQWQRAHADTTACLFESEFDWTFFRDRSLKRDSIMSSSHILRAYLYYNEKSLGGVSENVVDLRRFGRICYALSRHYEDSDSLLQADKLFHLAIHCAEASGDHAAAYRAYHQLGLHQVLAHSNANHDIYWSYKQALEKFIQYRKEQNNEFSNRGDAHWLLTMVNDYGMAYLRLPILDPRCFPTLIHAAKLPTLYLNKSLPDAVTDSVETLLNTVWKTPTLGFNNYLHVESSSYDKIHSHFTEIGAIKSGFEEALQTQENSSNYQDSKEFYQREFNKDICRAAQNFDIKANTYLAPGYAHQTSQLQTHLLIAALSIALLGILLLLALFWNWRKSITRKHEAEQAEQQQKAERATEEAKHLAKLLQQKETLIATLRGHIIDKSEILEMLESKAGKRAIINARNWREMEATLDTADNHFVSRLRREHPSFSEDDIRLCMLTRLKLNNTVLADIYAISVSAVQHRKQKLKKDGFGVTDSKVTLDQVIENY